MVTQPVRSSLGLKLEQCALESEHLRSRLGCLSLPLCVASLFQESNMFIGGKTSEGTNYEEVRGFPSGSAVKNLPAIQGPQEPWVRRPPGGGHGNPLQNPMDTGAWQATVQFSFSVVSDSLQSHELQHTSPLFHHQLPEFTQTHVH